ncbi:MAG: hypothetical protein SGI88_16795 [Candidatus Hydrogenedentes bacterium]|nr:hypothetical protein [Candidatus Hydrogenedentota bacterium]
MTSDTIPPETAQFIRTHISSLGLLEILLLLRDRSQTRFTATQISGQLRSSPEAVNQRLGALITSGFVSRTDGQPAQYGYAPQSREFAAMVDAISGLYEEYRGRIIDIIYSPRDPMQSFSEAFRFKKETDSNG